MTESKSQKANGTHHTQKSTKLALEIIEQDGLNHIRIDNRALTDLGRMLDSQYVIPFVHPELGDFNTTEGFWYYISLNKPYDLFRILTGHECRKYVSDLKESNLFKKNYVPNFYAHIQYANYLKIEANPYLKEEFIKSTLPFKMYFLKKKNKDDVIIKNTSSLAPRLNNIVELRDMYHKDPNFKMEMPSAKSILRLHAKANLK